MPLYVPPTRIIASNTTYTNGTVVLSGGNNVTVATNNQTVSISVASQSVQTQNMYVLTLTSNTAGAMAAVSSGTLTLVGGNNITLSQNANAITIHSSQSVQTQNLFVASVSAGNTTGTLALINSGTMYLAGGNNVTLSQSQNSVTISMPSGGGGGVVSFTDLPCNFGIVSARTLSLGSVMIYPSDIPYDMSGVYFKMPMEIRTSSNGSTDAFSVSISLAAYTLNGTKLSLASSAAFTTGVSANANNSLSYHGTRFIRWNTANGTISNTTWVLTGGQYWFGAAYSTSGATGITVNGFGPILGGGNSQIANLGDHSSVTKIVGPLGPAVYSVTTNSFPTTIGSANLLHQSNVFFPDMVLLGSDLTWIP